MDESKNKLATASEMAFAASLKGWVTVYSSSKNQGIPKSGRERQRFEQIMRVPSGLEWMVQAGGNVEENGLRVGDELFTGGHRTKRKATNTACERKTCHASSVAARFVKCTS